VRRWSSGQAEKVVGSVSGGCVEGAVYKLGKKVLAGAPPVLQRYGVSDDDAYAVGLTCGGTLDVHVEKVSPETNPEFGQIAEAIRDETPVAVATVVSGPGDQSGRRLIVWDDRAEGGTGSKQLDGAASDDARALLASGRNARMAYGVDGQRRGEGLVVFVESFAPPPRMIVFGAIDFAWLAVHLPELCERCAARRPSWARRRHGRSARRPPGATAALRRLSRGSRLDGHPPRPRRHDGAHRCTHRAVGSGNPSGT
jgi:xanthine/CO dehydrogenase XdhC/CoxF family maturation factor